MKHYVLLMEERKFLPDNYLSWHYIKNLPGNTVPELPHLTTLDNPDFGRLCSILRQDGYIEKPAPTIQEIILNDIALITLVIFGIDGKYKQLGIFERKIYGSPAKN